MKRVTVVVALLLCSPIAALGQTPRAPRAPSAPVAPLPPAPAIAPVPILPVPPVVAMALVDPPMLIEPMLLDVDIQGAIDASMHALEHLDVQVMHDQVLHQVDVEAIKAQAEQIKQQAQERNESMKLQAEAIKEQAKEQAKQAELTMSVCNGAFI